jgi:hypothetical protein
MQLRQNRSWWAAEISQERHRGPAPDVAAVTDGHYVQGFVVVAMVVELRRIAAIDAALTCHWPQVTSDDGGSRVPSCFYPGCLR